MYEVDVKKVIHLGDYTVEDNFKKALRTAKVLDVLISYDHYSHYYTAMTVLPMGTKVPEKYLQVCEERGLKAKAYIFEEVLDGSIWVFKMYI